MKILWQQIKYWTSGLLGGPGISIILHKWIIPNPSEWLVALIYVLGFTIYGLVIFSYFKHRIKKDVALIDQVGNSAKILADKVGSNCTNEQVISITQAIWQMYKDLGEKLGSFDEKSSDRDASVRHP